VVILSPREKRPECGKYYTDYGLNIEIYTEWSFMPHTPSGGAVPPSILPSQYLKIRMEKFCACVVLVLF
jgi:hypothetical protein